MSRPNPIVEKIKSRMQKRTELIESNRTEIGKLTTGIAALLAMNDDDAALLGIAKSAQPAPAPRRTRKKKAVVENEPADPTGSSTESCGRTPTHSTNPGQTGSQPEQTVPREKRKYKISRTITPDKTYSCPACNWSGDTPLPQGKCILGHDVMSTAELLKTWKPAK